MHITIEQGAILHIGNVVNEFPNVNITVKQGGTVIFDTEISAEDLLALQNLKKDMDSSFTGQANKP